MFIALAPIARMANVSDKLGTMVKGLPVAKVALGVTDTWLMFSQKQANVINKIMTLGGLLGSKNTDDQNPFIDLVNAVSGKGDGLSDPEASQVLHKYFP